MTPLPPGWARCTIGDLLLRIEAGRSPRCEPRPAADNEWGVIKVSAMTRGDFIQSENKALASTTSFNHDDEIKTGDILISRANTKEYVGASVLVGKCRQHLLLSDKSLRLVTFPYLDRQWFAHLLKSPGIRREISRRATGTKDSMRNISQSSLTSIEIDLPPLAEQRRIVTALDDYLANLDAATHSLRRGVHRAAVLKKRILASMLQKVTGPIVPLGDLTVSVRNGMFVSRPGTEPNGTPILRIGAVRALHLDLRDLRYTGYTENEVKKQGYLLSAGDLLFVRYNGNLDYVGACAVVPAADFSLTYPDKLIRVAVDRNKIIPDFLAMQCSIGRTRDSIRACVKTTAGQAGISGKEIKSVPVTVPSLTKQQEFVEEYNRDSEQIGRVETALAPKISQADQLRRSVLAEAFAGRLVEQDPADEPASVLLERISAERTAAGSVPRSRGRARASGQDVAS